MSNNKLVGRPTKLSNEIREALVELIARGVTIKDACGVVGISQRTFYNWMGIGEALADGDDHNDKPHKIAERQELIQFFQSVTHAKAEAAKIAILSVRSAMLPFVETSTRTERFEETRVNRSTGELYTYTRTLTSETVTNRQGDWRAAIRFLESYDPETWSRNPAIRVDQTNIQQNNTQLNISVNDDNFNKIIEMARAAKLQLGSGD